MIGAVLAAVGAIASVAAVVLLATATGDWGAPGSSAYERYEATNRLFGLLLAISVAAPVGLRQKVDDVPDARGARTILLGIAVTVVLMAIGSVAEFWIFSDQPYASAAGLGRNLAWSLFLTSGVAFLLLTVAAGAALWSRPEVPRPFGAVIALSVPVGVAAIAAGASLLITVPLAMTSMAVTALAMAVARRASAGAAG